MPTRLGPKVLVVLDGWGLNENKRGNAIAQAATPFMAGLFQEYPCTTLKASGEDVGLPKGQIGNSEVGHLNMGAGRVVYQELTRITKSIKDGDFFENPEILANVRKAKENNKALHLMGLLSDGGVHSHLEHLFAFLDLAKKEGLTEVFVHAFLDGRDVPPKNALEYIRPLEQKISSIGVGKIATIMGRYWAMDRDKRWERTQKAYEALCCGTAQYQVDDPQEAIKQAYERGETDEFVEPTVVKYDGEVVGQVEDGDSIILFNFRPDRARQITRAFVDEDFEGFARKEPRAKVNYLCLTQYDITIDAPVAFRPQSLENTLGQVLASNQLKQLRLAETEKYAHVTFFFNGGVEQPNIGEERILVPSPKVATYDLKPEMSAGEVTENFLKELEKDIYDVIIVNYANPDMVGHTGNMEAAIESVEYVDQCISKIVPAILAKGGEAIVTADHGNADLMADEAGNMLTAHSDSDVPFILVSSRLKAAKLNPGRLEDIAPTLLELLEVQKPSEMTGKSLILSN